MNPEAQLGTIASAPTVDRTRLWVWTTLAVQIGALILYPATVCGCHFHSEALVAGMVPVMWAGFTFLAYGSSKERLVAYVNAAVAIGWLFLAWDSNIQFAFR